MELGSAKYVKPHIRSCNESGNDFGALGKHSSCLHAPRRRGNRESSLSESEAHRNTAGEEKACPLQRVDHGE